MVTIRNYAIDPRVPTDNVRLEYTYTVHDSIADEDFERTRYASLTDGTGNLSDPKWGDDELCAALAAYLVIDSSTVVMASAE